MNSAYTTKCNNNEATKMKGGGKREK